MVASQHHQINLGALSQRVTGVEQGVAQLRNELQSNFAALANQVGLLSDKFERKSQTPWSTLIAAAGFIVLIGGLYSTLSLKPVEQAIAQNATDIIHVKNDLVPRGEHQEKWRANDAKFDDFSLRMVSSRDLLMQQIKSVSDSVEGIKQQVGSTYGIRDVLMDVQKRIDKLEDSKGREVK